jgi:hypothetical protein
VSEDDDAVLARLILAGREAAAELGDETERRQQVGAAGDPVEPRRPRAPVSVTWSSCQAASSTRLRVSRRQSTKSRYETVLIRPFARDWPTATSASASG